MPQGQGHQSHQAQASHRKKQQKRATIFFTHNRRMVPEVSAYCDNNDPSLCSMGSREAKVVGAVLSHLAQPAPFSRMRSGPGKRGWWTQSQHNIRASDEARDRMDATGNSAMSPNAELPLSKSTTKTPLPADRRTAPREGVAWPEAL